VKVDVGLDLLRTADDPYGCTDDDRSVAMAGLMPGGAKAQAMPFRLDGELPTPDSSGVVLTLATAKREGIEVGDSVRLAGWCDGGGERFEMDRVIDLTVTGTLVLDGTITADGDDGTANEKGGGAGGSILVHVATLDGTGRFSVDGGAGGGNDYSVLHE